MKQETEEVVQLPENKSVLTESTGSTAPGSGVIVTEYYDTEINHMKIAYSMQRNIKTIITEDNVIRSFLQGLSFKIIIDFTVSLLAPMAL